jgi:hypothetical protein
VKAALLREGGLQVARARRSCSYQRCVRRYWHAAILRQSNHGGRPRAGDRVGPVRDLLRG